MELKSPGGWITVFMFICAIMHDNTHSKHPKCFLLYLYIQHEQIPSEPFYKTSGGFARQVKIKQCKIIYNHNYNL